MIKMKFWFTKSSNKVSGCDNIHRQGLSYFVEYFLWAAGLICVVFYLSLVFVRQASSQVDVENFLEKVKTESSLESANPGKQSLLPIQEQDKSLWSEQRIKAYSIASELMQSKVTMGVLSIPGLGLNAPIYEGVDELVLNRGLGWIPDTAPIGTQGNVAIAGHRDSFFRVLKDIKNNDIIEIIGSDTRVRYRVTDTWIVTPDAVHVLDDTTQPVLTLVTCYPFYFVGHAPKRFIVRAVAIDPV